jgi:hypothetical protein
MVFIERLKDVGVNELSELEVACLFKVLSKPELNHKIMLNELMIVMENFGVPYEEPT